MEFSHRSVLLQESIDALAIRPDGIYLDGTLGGAGHSLEIARRLTTGRLIGIDQDTVALQAASQRLALYRDRVKLVHANFRALDTVLHDAGFTGVDGMLFDLGVSSPQLDDSSRGFSYMADAPLDMRMDRDGCLSAYEIINQTPEDELKRILWRYGEERYAAQARREKQHPAKRTFQAIRIAVNDELGAVEDMLGKAVDLLNPGGRLAVITFHSLEDRIVKAAMAEAARGCTCPPEFPVCICGKKPRVRLVTRKPIVPGAAELEENPRARSAKLRVAEKLP